MWRRSSNSSGSKNGVSEGVLSARAGSPRPVAPGLSRGPSLTELGGAPLEVILKIQQEPKKKIRRKRRI
eukprot:711830-Amphidinium_carterae.1